MCPWVPQEDWGIFVDTCVYIYIYIQSYYFLWLYFSFISTLIPYHMTGQMSQVRPTEFNLTVECY
jgi:hypothetical protein